MRESNSFAPMVPGDPLPTSVRVWNPILEAADAHQRGKTPGRSGSQINTDNYPGRQNEILVRNTTSVNWQRGTVVKVLRPYGTITTGDEYYQREMVFPATSVNPLGTDTSLVRLVDSIPTSKVGRASIISPFARVLLDYALSDPTFGYISGAYSNVTRHFAGQHWLNQPYYDTSQWYWLLSPITVSFAQNWAVTGWPNDVGQTHAPSTPVMRFDSTAVSNGFQAGFYPYHPCRFDVMFETVVSVIRPRYAVQISAVDVGYAYDGCSIKFGRPFGDPVASVEPVYMPIFRNSAGTASPATPPTQLESRITLRWFHQGWMTPTQATRLAPAIQATKVAAFASGGPSSPNLQIVFREAYVRWIILDVDDSVGSGGVLQPGTPPIASPESGSGPVATITVSSPPALLQISGRVAGGGGLEASSPPASMRYNRQITTAPSVAELDSPPALIQHNETA